MDCAPDLRAEDGVDEAMLLDAALPLEGGCGDGCAEVVAAAGVVLDLGSRTGDGGLDALPDVLWRRHFSSSLAAILWKAMLTISDKGAQKVREFLTSQEAGVTMASLRVGVRGGGGSGFQYQLALGQR